MNFQNLSNENLNKIIDIIKSKLTIVYNNDYKNILGSRFNVKEIILMTYDKMTNHNEKFGFSKYRRSIISILQRYIINHCKDIKDIKKFVVEYKAILDNLKNIININTNNLLLSETSDEEDIENIFIIGNNINDLPEGQVNNN